MPRFTNEADVLDFAAKCKATDRFGLPKMIPACRCFGGRLGWVPGVAYRDSMSNVVSEVLGYTQDGEVMVRRVDGEVITHRTRVSRTSMPIAVTHLGRNFHNLNKPKEAK